MRPLLVHLGFVFALALAGPALVGCAGNEGGPGAADPSRPPPRDVLAMPVRVQSGSHSTFAAALADGLARAGFTVTTDGSAKVDIILTPNVTISQNTSAFQVTVNGRSKMRITITVAVVCDGHMTDMLRAEYNDYDGEPPDEEAIAKLVLAYAHSSRVASFAKQRMAVVQEAESEDQEWQSIELAKCATPTTLDACEPLRQYLKAHPQGRHASEATRILAQSGPQFERLQKDENSWQSAGGAECRVKKTREACVGLEVYLTKFPNGMHAQEAHALLGK